MRDAHVIARKRQDRAPQASGRPACACLSPSGDGRQAAPEKVIGGASNRQSWWWTGRAGQMATLEYLLVVGAVLLAIAGVTQLFQDKTTTVMTNALNTIP